MRRLATPLALALAVSIALASGTSDAQRPSASAPSPVKAVASGPLGTGLAALAASDYATAETDLASVKGAGELDAKLGLAQAAFEQGKYADADKHAQAALSSAAHKVKASVLRAEVLAATGKKAEAIKLLAGVTPSTAKGADVRRARLLLGEYLIDVGKRADADDPLHKVIDEYNDGTITSNASSGSPP